MAIVDIFSLQQIVPSSPLLTVQPCSATSRPSFPLDVVFLHETLKHWNETSAYKHVPKVQLRVLSLATVIMLASGPQERSVRKTSPFAQRKSCSYMFCCDLGVSRSRIFLQKSRLKLLSRVNSDLVELQGSVESARLYTGVVACGR